MSSLNSKKATKLIKGEGFDKIKRAKFTCQLSSSGCPVCLASLRTNPDVKLHPHLIMPGKKRMRVILATRLAYCPNLFMAKTPKKRIKKVIKVNMSTYCLDADRNCLCRVQSKMQLQLSRRKLYRLPRKNTKVG